MKFVLGLYVAAFAISWVMVVAILLSPLRYVF
jgi:hypothetical protein